MVDRANEIWEIRLDDHKTAHHGLDRTIFVGPNAQAILLPYLLREADSFCFDPSEGERKASRRKTCIADYTIIMR